MLMARGKQWSEENVVRRKLDKQMLKTRALTYSICGILGFLFTRLQILGILSGFGFPFLAAIPMPYALSGLLGGAIGGIFEGLNGEVLFGIAAAVLWISAEQILEAVALPKHFLGTFWKISAMSVLLGGRVLFLYFWKNLALAEAAILVFASVAQIAVFFCTLVVCGAFFSGQKIEEHTPAQLCSGTVLAILVITALERFPILGISMAGILSAAAVTVFAYRFGCVGGGIAGILSGMGTLLYSMERTEYVGMLIFGGFLAGLTARRSKMAAAISMMVVHYGLILFYGKPLLMLSTSICIMIGVMLFICLPESFLERIALPEGFWAHGPPRQEARLNKQLEQRMQIQMDFAADAVDMLGESVDELANLLKQEVRPDNEQLYAAVENQLCRNCKKRFVCYGEEYDRIRKDFDGLTYLINQRKLIEAKDFPDFLKRNCVRPTELIQVFTKSYQQFRSQALKQQQIDKTRALVIEQYTAMGQLLRDFGDGMHLKPNRFIELEITQTLSKEGYAPKRVCCGQIPAENIGDEKSGEDAAEIYFLDVYYGESTPPVNELKELLERQLGRTLNVPVVADAKYMTRVSFYEPPPFSVQIGISQKAAGDNRREGKRYNGDTVISFYDGRGNFYLLLSDGMGRGKRAALDSMTVCTILSKLIAAGFGWRAALKFLNTSLMVRSTEETLATVDIVCVNLFKGEVEFIKAGAASSFWGTGKAVSRIRSFTLPVGIVSGIQFDSKKIQAASGDVILLCSDGVGEEDGWIASQILRAADRSMQELTDSICAEARQRSAQNPDDITAAAIRLIGFQT